MNKPHPPQKILNLGLEEISFPCSDIGILEFATRIIVVKCLMLRRRSILAAHHAEWLIHFNLGLLALDDSCKKKTVFTIIVVRYKLWSSFFSYNKQSWIKFTYTRTVWIPFTISRISTVLHSVSRVWLSSLDISFLSRVCGIIYLDFIWGVCFPWQLRYHTHFMACTNVPTQL